MTGFVRIERDMLESDFSKFQQVNWQFTKNNQLPAKSFVCHHQNDRECHKMIFTAKVTLRLCYNMLITNVHCLFDNKIAHFLHSF